MDPQDNLFPIVTNSAEDEALDPVCGMTVDKSSAKHTLTHDGAQYYFCSRSCREKFAANPAAYLAGQREPMHASGNPTEAVASAPAPPGSTYICPMHLEVRQQGPGSCPSAAWRWSRKLPSARSSALNTRARCTRKW